MKNRFTKLSENLGNIELPELKPFDYLCLKGPHSLNGYVVIPDGFPLNYFDEFYSSVDDGPVGGLTFGGYVTLFNGEQSLMALDNNPWLRDVELSEFDMEIIQQAKKKSVRVIGFDDNHIYPNQLGTEDGAKYLSEQLKALGVRQ